MGVRVEGLGLCAENRTVLCSRLFCQISPYMASFSEQFAEFESTNKPHQGPHVLEKASSEEGPHEFDEVLMELMKLLMEYHPMEPEMWLQLSGQQYARGH